MSIMFTFPTLNVIVHQWSKWIIPSITNLVRYIVIFGSHVNISISNMMISCTIFSIYNFMLIIMTRIKIAEKDVLIPGSKWPSWLFSPSEFLSFLVVIMIITSRFLFNFIFWELGIFAFNFLTNAENDTRLFKWRYLVA